MVHAGTDIGGTFTDIVVHDPVTGAFAIAKTPTTPVSPADGALAGVRSLLAASRMPLADLRSFVHGTTIATNAVLQRRLPRTALVTNAGFEDICEIGRQDRPHLYDAERKRAPPVVAREDAHGIAGRLAHDGRELEPLVLDAAALAGKLSGVQAIAVCLLHSYASDVHERRVADALSRALPEIPVSLSCDVAPEFREYERASTTALNAALVPLLDRYLGDLETLLLPIAPLARLLVLESSGGVLGPAAARRRPVSAILSGPAGGVLACARLAGRLREPNLVGIDVGGTSADVSLVVDGAAASRPETRIAGLPVRTPVLDIETIGAGGGSVAFVEGGFLRVGPRSAEAVPGPACYGRGGAEPTLTDAHVVLGRLPEGALLGSGVELRPDLAREAVGGLAKALGVTVEDAAQGIVDVANARMAGAIRVLTTARGLDPADFALCAFGGAGPLHAVDLARELAIPRVVVPSLAGVFSAYGVLCADLRHDLVRTHVVDSASARPGETFAPLIAAARRALDDEAVPEADRAFALTVEARLLGQSHEVAVPVEPGSDGSAIAASFRAAYAARYGRVDASVPVELVNWRVAAIGRRPAPPAPRVATGPSPGPAGNRTVLFPEGPRIAPVWRAADLRAGQAIEAPAIVLGTGFTAVLPPGLRARVDAEGNLAIEVDG